MLTSRDQVIVTNHEDYALNWRLDGREVVVPAGATMHVPFDVVRMNLGDPRSGVEARVAMDGNEKVRIASRSDELKRLETLYGISGATITAIREGEVPPKLHERAPNVTVTTADAEPQPLLTVIQDPGGDNPAPIPMSLDTPDAVAAQIAQQQQQLDGLMARLKAMEATGDGAGEDDVTEDTPTGGGQGGPPAGQGQAPGRTNAPKQRGA